MTYDVSILYADTYSQKFPKKSDMKRKKYNIVIAIDQYYNICIKLD